MTTTLALIEQALGNNHTRKIEHTSAHGLDQDMEKQRVYIEPTWRESTHTYVVDGQTIHTIRRIITKRDPHMDRNAQCLSRLGSQAGHYTPKN